MAFIRKRGKKFSVIYRIKDDNGKERQTSETFSTQKDAEKRKKEIEYKIAIGKFSAHVLIHIPKDGVLNKMVAIRLMVGHMIQQMQMEIA